jgi:3'-5' exoribonuclease
MKRTCVADLTPGEAVRSTFLVRSKERKTTRNGDGYLDLELQDSTGSIGAKLWGCDDFDLSFEVDDVVQVAGEVREYQGTRQLTVRKIAKCGPDEVDLLDYFPRTKRDPEEMYSVLTARLARMPEGPIRSLLLSVVEDPALAPKLKLAPAAMSYHHAYLGGLLEHICSLLELGDRVADHYPSLSRDLVLAGLVLHDIGKIEELSFSRGFRYSTRGQLVGHISIGLEIVHEKMRAIPDFPERLRDQIEHIILAHHGRLEFGSPKEPMFPEALVVHYLDDLDSKLKSMYEQYQADKDHPGDWTSRNRPLGRELLKMAGEEPAKGSPKE